MRTAILTTSLITIVLTLLLFTSGFFVLFTPLPIAYLFVKKGKAVAAIVGVLSFLMLVLLYQVPFQMSMLPLSGFEPALTHRQTAALGSVYFFYFLWMGFNVGVLSRKPWSTEKGFLYLLIATLVVPGAVLVLASRGAGWSLLEELRVSFGAAIDRMIGLQKEAGLGGEEILFLQKYKNEIVRDVISLMPSIWINFFILTVALNISFLKRLCPQERMLRLIFPTWAEFPLWSLKEGVVWVPIATAALYFCNIYFLQKDAVDILCLNTLIVFGAIYFIQGLAVTSFILKTRLGPMMRMTVYFLIFIFLQIFGIIILAMGVFDFWFDFRRLKKQK